MNDDAGNPYNDWISPAAQRMINRLEAQVTEWQDVTGEALGGVMLPSEVASCIKESEREIQIYREALHKIQVALDIRCIDDPNKVGCEDRMFDMPDDIAELKARLAKAEGRAVRILRKSRGC